MKKVPQVIVETYDDDSLKVVQAFYEISDIRIAKLSDCNKIMFEEKKYNTVSVFYPKDNKTICDVIKDLSLALSEGKTYKIVVQLQKGSPIE
jgi:hypothetical protein